MPDTVWILRNSSSVIILQLLSMNQNWFAPHKFGVSIDIILFHNASKWIIHMIHFTAIDPTGANRHTKWTIAGQRSSACIFPWISA